VVSCPPTSTRCATNLGTDKLLDRSHERTAVRLCRRRQNRKTMQARSSLTPRLIWGAGWCFRRRQRGATQQPPVLKKPCSEDTWQQNQSPTPSSVQHQPGDLANNRCKCWELPLRAEWGWNVLHPSVNGAGVAGPSPARGSDGPGHPPHSHDIPLHPARGSLSPRCSTWAMKRSSSKLWRLHQKSSTPFAASCRHGVHRWITPGVVATAPHCATQPHRDPGAGNDSRQRRAFC